MVEKRCYKCGRDKLVAAFSKDRRAKDGLHGQCKTCVKIYQEARKVKKAEYDQEYHQSHKTETTKQRRIYNQTFAGKESHKKNSKTRCRKFPEKIKANNIVGYAVIAGKLERSVFCEECGLPAKTEGHHSNYNKPLEIDWLCKKCHMNLHNKKRKF